MRVVEAAVKVYPPLIRVCYPLFVASVIGLGALGLAMIWTPKSAEWILKALGSLGIVAGVTALVLAGYRTISLTRSPGD